MEDLTLLAKTHYENFPVGSRMIPKEYREPIHLIYAFARVADDIADEGSASVEDRIRKIDEWQSRLHSAIDGKSHDQFFLQLAETIRRNELSIELFDDLLVAFRKDASNSMYETFNEVLEYCRYSANPIGRLLLQLFRCSTDHTTVLSDKICTALQLSNFWQDISVDTRRNRFYIPRSDLKKFNLNQSDFNTNQSNEKFRAMMKMRVEQTRNLFLEGKPLFTMVSNDFQFELKLIWNGGIRILEKIESLNFDTRKVRPKHTIIDSTIILTRALFSR